MLSTVKSFEMLPKHKGYGFIAKNFAILSYKKLLLPL